MKLKILFITITALLIYSCENDDIPDFEPLGDYQYGLLITNQGPFNNGFGSVSYVDPNLSEAENTIFQNVNEDNLGNVINAIGFYENKAYVVANVSNRITVVDRFTFTEMGRIEDGLNNPRFFQAVNGKGYVSNWGDPNNPSDDYIAVIDLDTNEIIKEITVSEGPEKIARAGSVVYVLHQGGYNVNNEVSVIDTLSDEIISTLSIGDVPNSYDFDAQGNLWILSGGAPSYTGEETNGSISVISTTSNEVSETFNFDTTVHPSALNIENGNVYYYNNGEVYEGNSFDFEVPTESILSGLNFFNMKVSGNAILGVDAGDFNSNGELVIYNLSSLRIFNTIELGVIPDQIYLN
ncbi:DUF5074 domain-containing protein [Dokdonia sp. Hel_I_53]|uniref:DUF5074 domain-containing protein n=1 Tax=Dokdonia sp. Hel_I_53 TaxID=1566287 RepID=UPI00119BDA40|nr:DUF5074 domain-containing protein [Dokdonia sp. Hel_I_53]TVZ51027.1 hypothetical protein OD90_0163 [Dokdonia sp. Hel_I_53]